METKETKAPDKGVDRGKADAVDAMAELYTGGIERFAEVQKKVLEVAIRHNSEVVKTWKKMSMAAPGILMLDLAVTTFERFAETQKGVIDLMVEQAQKMASQVKERKVKGTDAIEEGVEKTREAIKHSVAAQKSAIDYTAKQTKEAFATAKQQFGYAGTPAGTAADSIERGLDILVDAHKELLDLVAEPAVH